MSEQYRTVDKFDRLYGAIVGLPDSTRSGASTVVEANPIIGATQTFIVETIRRAEIGDTVFVQYVDDEGSIRIALPPRVVERIARQRDALTGKVRRKHGKAQAAARKARGEVPAFLKVKRGEAS